MTRYLAILLSLAAVTICVAAEKVNTLLENITYEFPGGSGFPPSLVIHTGEASFAKIVAKYPSRDAFQQELVQAWNSEDEKVRYFALHFTCSNLEYLRITQTEIDILTAIARDPDRADDAARALRCLSGLRRRELIPLFLEQLSQPNTYAAYVASDALKEQADALTEADMRSILPRLDDPREIRLGGGGFSYQLPLSACFLEVFQTLGPRAECVREPLLKKYVLESCRETYDPAKFQAFLDKIQQPDTDAAGFWRAADAAGLLDECFPQLADKEWYEFTLQCAFAKAYHAVAPDDSFGLFLLLKTAVNPNETEGGTPAFFLEEYCLDNELGGPRELLPVLDFCAAHPEIVVPPEIFEDWNPQEVSWVAKLAALQAPMSGEECERRVRDLVAFSETWGERQYSLSDLEDRILEYQPDHVPALGKLFPELYLEPEEDWE